MLSPKILLPLAMFAAGLQAQVTVLNGASFRTDQPIAAGSWATAFGNFAGVSNTIAPSFPLPKALGGVTVTVEGVDAAVYFVGSTQINFLIPYAAAAGLRNVQVKTAAGTVSGSVRVITSAPGLFTKDAQSPPKGAILNQNSIENTSSNTAARGEVIQIYGTGPGALKTAVQDGVGPPADPLVLTVSTPQVFIGGVEATVQFSGLAPGLPGVWQVNAFIPNLSFIAGRVPVRVFMDGVDSNEVTIFVQP